MHVSRLTQLGNGFVPGKARHRSALAVLTMLAVAVAGVAHADTYTVTTIADSGIGSLRQAILDANFKQVTNGQQCARHSIVFNIPGNGTHSIALLSALPSINIPITFDGYTQPGSTQNTAFIGSNAVLTIELDGSLAGNADALVIGAAIPGSGVCPGSTSWIRGLVINRFGGAAISMGGEVCPPNQVCTVGGVLIQGNYIGTDVTGSIALGNGATTGRPAILFGTSSSFNTVGDEIPELGGSPEPVPFVRNVISGNTGDAIRIVSASSTPATGVAEQHRIRNNYIGVSASGTAAVPNGGRGISLGINSTGISVYDNLISGNASDGVAIADSRFPGTTVLRNGIGIGVTGLRLGNGGDGVIVSGNAVAVTVSGRFRYALSVAAIANNAGAGLFVDANALVDAGAISSAYNGGLAVDLAPPGVNPNDVGDTDSGPNELLNAPVLDPVILNSSTGTSTVAGTLVAAPSSAYSLAFFYSDSCDPSGFGGGQTPFPLNINVTTDALGNASFSRQVEFLPASKFLTAINRAPATTATSVFISSEFSNCRRIVTTADQIFMHGFE